MRRVSSTAARIAGAISLARARSNAQSPVSPVAARITAASSTHDFAYGSQNCATLLINRPQAQELPYFESGGAPPHSKTQATKGALVFTATFWSAALLWHGTTDTRPDYCFAWSEIEESR